MNVLVPTVAKRYMHPLIPAVLALLMSLCCKILENNATRLKRTHLLITESTGSSPPKEAKQKLYGAVNYCFNVPQKAPKKES